MALYIGAGIVVADVLILIFIIYGLLPRLIDKQINTYQNNLLSTHYAEVDNIYREMRGWRHDYHNHMQTIKAYLQGEQITECLEYLDHLEDDLKQVDTVLKTGNVKVDAILNSKLSLAKSLNIAINATAKVPKSLTVLDTDLCIIIGNLLENAIEACGKITKEEDRFIRVYVGVMKKQLYISIMNSTNVKERKIGAFFTTKGDNHGFGLKRVEATVKKYEGYLNRQNEPGVFATEIILPL